MSVSVSAELGFVLEKLRWSIRSGRWQPLRPDEAKVLLDAVERSAVDDPHEISETVEIDRSVKVPDEVEERLAESDDDDEYELED